MTSPRRAIVAGFAAACALALLARSAEPATPATPSGTTTLAPYAVTEGFVGEFYVKHDVRPSKRLWLVSVRKNPDAPIAPRWTGADIKSGDEIVGIAGRSVAEMAPDEPHRLLFAVIPRKNAPTIEIEICSPGAKASRKATLRFVPAPPGTKPDYSDSETAKSHGLPPPRPATDK